MSCPGPDADAVYTNRTVSDTGTPAGRNRLCRETSPYLLQHANNPVDWHPWDEEALALARSENKPIFLSIGYAACHWCHVMERESFENETIAAFMNAHFVNIKVDREERPDLDTIYMNAVTAMTGSGGWPLNVFLTPALQPFYGGTYFPPNGLYGLPSFLDVLQQIVALWNNDPARVLTSAEQLTTRLRAHLEDKSAAGAMDLAALRAAAAEQLIDSYDKRWGGWGGAPKFPSPASCTFLLRQYRRTGESSLLDMAVFTLKQMALGGLYDQVGGGFHRYSTDEKWCVPHFEKMLYDNAQLAIAYLEAWQVTREPFFKTVACDTLHYVLRDMRGDNGAFYSAEDADSEGEEGRYYLWTRQEIMDTLGEKEGKAFCRYYSVMEEGNFSSRESYHQGKNILYRRLPENTLSDEDEARYADSRAKLLEVRQTRVRPAVDDKILSSWNALMISALARAAFAWDIPAFKEAACKAGQFIKDNLISEDRIYRSWRLGRTRYPGYLDDYALAANAYMDLYECTAEMHWLETAKLLVDRMIERFQDTEGQGFYSTESEQDDLLMRVKTLHDTAEPSANAMAALSLVRCGRYYEVPGFSASAEKSLELAASEALRAPLGYLHTMLAADYVVDSPVEIIVCGQPEEVQVLKQTIGQQFIPCRVVAYANRSRGAAEPPLCTGKTAVEAKGTVYVCQGRRCLAPVTAAEEVERLLSGFNEA